jgi:hypothetical protein
VIKHLHIITQDIPYPADTPILRDTMNKIMALNEKGVKIHLHCYAYGKEKPAILNELCHEVHYYKRNRGHTGFSFPIPYIISSRANHALEERLSKDNYPIIFEGLHTTFLLRDVTKLRNRKIFVRLHRLESRYYGDLTQITPFGPQKIYYFIESMLCRNHEKQILGNVSCIVSSEELSVELNKIDNEINSQIIPQFTGRPSSFYKGGKGNFCLYFGKLSERENEYTALWLLENVFSKIDIPFVIAGTDPSSTLEQAAHLRMHTCLVANPTEKELQDLIKKAQVCLLPSFISSNTGEHIRESLILGKHVLTNKKGMKEKELIPICSTALNPEEFIQQTSILFEKEFSEEDHYKREHVLSNEYNCSNAADQLIRILY